MARELKQRPNLHGVAIALVLAALGMTVLGIAGKQPADLWQWIFASQEDGAWLATSFDGRPVASNYYLVSVRHGEVVGGHDDCNGWSYQDTRPDRKGERMIISTAQECPTDEPNRIYWILVHAPKIQLESHYQMRLSRAGHIGQFRRCRPDRRSMRCVPVA